LPQSFTVTINTNVQARDKVEKAQAIHDLHPISAKQVVVIGLGLRSCPQVFFSPAMKRCQAKQIFCVGRATRHGSSRAASAGSLYKGTGLSEIGWMKREITVVGAVALGCLFSAERLCAETEPQAPPAAETAPSPPAGIIVNPPISIPPRPEMMPPANSPPPSCPATDRKLELIG